MANALTELKKYTTVVADTGDFATLKAYEPQDATTNPTLILKAIEQDEYRPLFDQAVQDCRGTSGDVEARIDRTVDRLLILFGLEILKIVPGRVSTEVDAALSFDVAGSIAKARELIALYADNGIARERVLIKLATTWEGIQAARALQQEGIHCNMTLLFSLAQAIGAAEAGAQLISPFVGRILDWYKKAEGRDYEAHEDPGVQSVREIYAYYKKFGYPTEVMGASFRNTGEILELAGCDLLTISPKLLEPLQAMDAGVVTRKLDPESQRQAQIERITMDEKRFRWMLNEDAMGTEKLAEGIRVFAKDMNTVKDRIRQALG